jgi:hypothetical protein
MLMQNNHNHHLLKAERIMVELSTLRVFLAAAEELNFSNAAKRLHHLTICRQPEHPSHGACLQRGTFILRHGRSVELSEAGQSILPMVREVLLAARMLEDGLQEIHTRSAGN